MFRTKKRRARRGKPDARYESFAEAIERAGFKPVRCDPYYWQIWTSPRHYLLDVWPLDCGNCYRVHLFGESASQVVTGGLEGLMDFARTPVTDIAVIRSREPRLAAASAGALHEWW